MNKKKWLQIIAVLLCLAVIAAVGIIGLKKLRSMYNNVLQSIEYTHQRVIAVKDTLNEGTAQLSDRISNLEREMREIWIANKVYPFEYEWMNASSLIAHAGGSIDERTYTNSYEAFAHNYALGHRIFEIDMDLTNEGALVCSHGVGDWTAMTGSDAASYTLDQFQQTPLHGEYHSMDYQQAIDFLAEHPDAVFVLDTKFSDEASVKHQLSQLVWYCHRVDSSVLDRLVPQIYHENMLEWIMDIYPFRSVIFTLYQTAWTPESVAAFCRQTGVRFITMPASSLTPEIAQAWKALGIHIAVHTENDLSAAKALLDIGADMIYTDFITPDQLASQ